MMIEGWRQPNGPGFGWEKCTEAHCVGASEVQETGPRPL
jgi:hypothetical protein